MKDVLKKVIFVGLFLVPLIPFFVSGALFFPFITTKAFAWRILVEIVFGAWLLLAAFDREYRPKRGPILYAVFGFIAVIGLSDLFGALPSRSFWSNYERMEGFISLLHLGAYFLVVSSFFKEVDWKRWWNTTLVASAIMVCYSLFQVLGAIKLSQSDARVDGTLGNAIYLAVYMLFHIFIGLFYMMKEWKNVTLRWVYGLLIFSQLFILYYTATRGTILGLLGGLLILALLNLKNKENPAVKKLSVGLITLVVVVIGGFFLIRDAAFVQSSPVLSRFANLNLESVKTQGRYFIWPMALKGIGEHPILGWGQENFVAVFQKYYEPEMYGLEPWFDRAHNIFLDWAVAGGVVGLLFYLSLYFLPLYLIWRKGNVFSSLERSILTALFAAYFFHNFFVFDHLISYILFFSVLAYIHTRIITPPVEKVSPVPRTTINIGIATALVTVFTLGTLYYVNIKPLRANTALIGALQSVQRGDHAQAVKDFQRAYEQSRLGRQEVLEQMAVYTPQILQSNLAIEERNEFYTFAKEALLKEEDILGNDTKYQLITGSFLSTTGNLDEAVTHLEKALTLSPKKQQVYFELASTYLSKNDLTKGLSILKDAYELSPEYYNAKEAYLLGAIYIGDVNLENSLIQKFNEVEFTFSDRIVSGYFAKKRFPEVIAILENRIKLDPANKTVYEEYIEQVKNSQ